MARLDEFAGFTDEPGKLTRLYLSPAYRAACERFAEWAAQLGMEPEIDAAGNVHARYEGKATGAPALMIGSHIDTVRDAGRYDGNLGALAALAVVEQCAAGERLDHAIDVVAFGDEEGVRFPTAMTGSRALAGIGRASCLTRATGTGSRCKRLWSISAAIPKNCSAARPWHQRLHRTAHRTGAGARGRGSSDRHGRRDQRRDPSRRDGQGTRRPRRRRANAAAPGRARRERRDDPRHRGARHSQRGEDLVATVGRHRRGARRGQRHPRAGAVLDRHSQPPRRMAPPRGLGHRLAAAMDRRTSAASLDAGADPRGASLCLRTRAS